MLISLGAPLETKVAMETLTTGSLDFSHLISNTHSYYAYYPVTTFEKTEMGFKTPFEI